METLNASVNNATLGSTPEFSSANAKSRAAKVFGRFVYKAALIIPYTFYHHASLGVELFFGAGGAVVGALRGGTVTLVKAAGSKLGACQKSTKSLSDYVIQDFHRGVRVGWLPGKIIGATSAACFTVIVCLNPIVVGATAGTIGVGSLVLGGIAYHQIKSTGESVVEETANNFLSIVGEGYKSEHDHIRGE